MNNLRTRNNNIFCLLLALLYLPATLKYGYKMVLSLAVLILTGMLLNKILNRPQKVFRNYAPATVLMAIPLILPPALPLYMILISLLFGLIVAVIFFGGASSQIVSASALSWGFCALSYPQAFNDAWVFPLPGFELNSLSIYTASYPVFEHPAAYLHDKNIDLMNILMGNIPGTGASAFPILLLLLCIVIVLLKAVDIRAALSFIITVLLLSFLFTGESFETTLASLLSGNLFIAGFFLLPQYKLTARDENSALITAVLSGVVAWIVRNWSAYDDGSLFAVLFYNVFSPLIDEIMYSRFKHRVRRYE